MNERIVRIGGASGAWGDSPMGPEQLLAAGVDYLVMDFLAEVTMSLLAKARLKDAEAGFPPDFVAYLKPHLAALRSGRVRVVSNAGGVNPRACQRALEAAAEAAGVELRVAVVEGDDLLPRIDEMRAADVREWRSDAPLPARLLSANAYLGALPIARALATGADVVVTGRCVDSALALGILMHEFGWQAHEFDLLAAGSLVGHLLECGPQAVGGLFTDWESVPGWDRIGYPIAECRADGRFVLTKPAGSGGLVSPAAAAEQVLYEVGDPAAYLLPDVSADFSQVGIEPAGINRVLVSGARGRPPTAQYKVSATYQEGFRAVALLSIVGIDAVPKAERVAEALVTRGRTRMAARGHADFSAVHVEVLGGEASYGKASRARAAREVVLRLVVEHGDAKALDVFAREIGSAGLSFSAGITSLLGGRPKPAPVVRLFTFFVDKASLAAPTVTLGSGEAMQVPLAAASGAALAEPMAPSQRADADIGASPTNEPMVEAPLLTVAHARSGDKGDSSNVAIFCRRPGYMPHLRRVLTAERMAAHFAELVAGPVVRYEAPGLHAFNFVMENALGGGGMASLRIDPLGKAYGQRALEMIVAVPASWRTKPA